MILSCGVSLRFFFFQKINFSLIHFMDFMVTGLGILVMAGYVSAFLVFYFLATSLGLGFVF